MALRDGSPRLPRRRFLAGSALAALGVSALGSGARLGHAAREDPAPSRPADPAAPRVRARRPLGKTGIEMSDISFGSSRTSDPELVRYAFERGIDYFDTAESYEHGDSEEAVGKGLAGVRDRVVIVSKTHCDADTTRTELDRALEGSLRRLRTDHVDIYLNHAVNDVDRLKNPAWPEFVERAKRAGKIRFAGMSGHGGRLIECLDYALDHDLAEVILVAYNFGQDPSFLQGLTRSFDFIAVQPDLPRVLAKARAKGVGTVAMKTLRGAKLNDMRPFEKNGATFAQAAFRWVLENPDVSGLVVSMTSREQIDEYLGASGGEPPERAELDLLGLYLATAGADYCNHGCAACEPSCPAGVPISEVLRTRMYATHYQDVAFARAEYASLPVDASACASCTGLPCLGACPHGLAVPRLTTSAHRMLAAEAAPLAI
jgi:predicted aldo/keto reductase-like oxidoreductase